MLLTSLHYLFCNSACTAEVITVTVPSGVLDSEPVQPAFDSEPMQLAPLSGVLDVPEQYLLTGTVDSCDRSGYYDDALLPILIQLRHSELPDSTPISVSKGLLQQMLQSGMSVF